MTRAKRTYTEEQLRALRGCGLVPPPTVAAVEEIIVRRVRKTKRKPGRPICLDYLKGKCDERRYCCKYQHPPLPPKKVVSDPADDVCDVYFLTGFCKFGSSCRNYHPPVDEFLLGAVAAPLTTKYQQRQVQLSHKRGKKDPRGRPNFKSLRRHVSDVESSVSSESVRTEKEGSEGEHSSSGSATSGTRESEAGSVDTGKASLPSSPDRTTGKPSLFCGGLDATVRRVNGLLNRLTPEKFDSLAEQLATLILTSESNCLARVLPLIWSKAIAEGNMGDLYASLCVHIWVRCDAQITMASSLLELTYKLLYYIDTSVYRNHLDNVDDEQLAKLQRKRLGNVRFVGQLFNHGIITLDDLRPLMNFLVAKTHDVEGDGAFHVELLVKLTQEVGLSLCECDGPLISSVLERIREAANDLQYPTRTRVIAQDLLDLAQGHWVPRREALTPKTLAEHSAPAPQAPQAVHQPPRFQPSFPSRSHRPPCHRFNRGPWGPETMHHPPQQHHHQQQQQQHWPDQGPMYHSGWSGEWYADGPAWHPHWVTPQCHSTPV